MITAAMTLSEADAYLAVKGDEQYAEAARAGGIPAWVAIDDGNSPFHDGDCGHHDVLRMRFSDWDTMSPWRNHRGSASTEPKLEHAHAIVRHLIALQWGHDRRVVMAHCHQGLFRSGAIVEWLRADMGVPEHALSRRLVDLIDDGLARTNTRPFNFTLLHLLRRAAAEQGCRATQCRACGGNSLFVAGRFGHLPHGKECGHEFSDIRRDEPDEYPMFYRITEENRP